MSPDGLLVAELASAELLGSTWLWGAVVGALGLILLIPRTTPRRRAAGGVLGLAGLGLLASGLPMLPTWSGQAIFWLLGAITLMSAAAAVSSRSAVYAAIWFALSLVGVAGLFLVQGAQFLAVATIVVYAGAIVVTFLFVVMLAQPEGHSSYDRISWGWYPKPLSAIAAALMLIVVSVALGNMDPAAGMSDSMTAESRDTGILHTSHMARLGAELFSKHLVAVEVAGTLLLVALVGAIAIMIHGQAPNEPEEGGHDE